MTILTIIFSEKRDETNKARTCTDGWKQKNINKKVMALPTVNVDSDFITCVTEAKEHYKVANLDFPSEFFHA